MRTLNGQPIDPKRLEAHAEAMFDALLKIAESATEYEDNQHTAEGLRDIAAQALAPCHFFDFNVPANCVANTAPEDMEDEAFEAWLGAIPEDKREGWKTRRWVWRAALSYVGSIRNQHKQDYALGYLNYLFLRQPQAPRVSWLSCMAAQAVRLHLDELVNKGAPTMERKPQPAQPSQGLLMPLDPFTQPALI